MILYLSEYGVVFTLSKPKNSLYEKQRLEGNIFIFAFIFITSS